MLEHEDSQADTAKESRRWEMVLAVMIWYGVGALIILPWLPNLMAVMSGDTQVTLEFIRAGLATILILLFFILVGQLLWHAHNYLRALWEPQAGIERQPEEGVGFPAPITLVVGGWLVIFIVASVLMLYLLLASPSVLPGNLKEGSDVLNALVTGTAAALGAAVTTVLGYLKHVSVRRDFKTAFSPWYVAQPINGILLGLIFYFLLRGGLLGTVGSEPPNPFGLAGIGALVGLFSNNALAKLKEVFDTLFRTEEESIKKVTRTVGEELEKTVREKLLARADEHQREILISLWEESRAPQHDER